jgi:hypothetical protein
VVRPLDCVTNVDEPGRRAWTSTVRRARGTTTTLSTTVRPTLTVVRSSLNPLMRVRPCSEALAGAVRAALYLAGLAAIADTESGTAQMAMTNAQIDGRRMRDQPDCLMIDCLLLRRERRY